MTLKAGEASYFCKLSEGTCTRVPAPQRAAAVCSCRGCCCRIQQLKPACGCRNPFPNGCTIIPGLTPSVCANLGLKSGKCEFSVVSFSPYRLPTQARGVKALCKNVIIHREINFHEACKVLAGEKSALTKVTMCFLWGFVMGKTQGAAQHRGDRALVLSRGAGGLGGELNLPSQGWRGCFCGS